MLQELRENKNGFMFDFDKASENFILMSDEEKIQFFESLSMSDRNSWFIHSLNNQNKFFYDFYINYLCDVEEWCAKPVNDKDSLILPNGLIVPNCYIQST